jgi:hypothetical protein
MGTLSSGNTHKQQSGVLSLLKRGWDFSDGIRAFLDLTGIDNQSFTYPKKNSKSLGLDYYVLRNQL